MKRRMRPIPMTRVIVCIADGVLASKSDGGDGFRKGLNPSYGLNEIVAIDPLKTHLPSRLIFDSTPSTSLRGALLSAEARLRAKADATKQSIFFPCSTKLDCFASLAMRLMDCAVTRMELAGWVEPLRNPTHVAIASMGFAFTFTGLSFGGRGRSTYPTTTTLLAASCFASRARETLRSCRDKTTRWANHFGLSEIMSSPSRKNISVLRK